MVIEALAVGSAFEMAVRFTNGGLGGTLGARYESFSILPHAPPEQPDPVMLQLKAFSLVPVTLAVTAFDSPAGTFRSLGGEMLTAIPDLEGLGSKSLLSGL